MMTLGEKPHVLADGEVAVVLAGGPEGVAAEVGHDAGSGIPRPLFRGCLRRGRPECRKRQCRLRELEPGGGIDASVIDRAAEDARIEEKWAVATNAVAIQVVAEENGKWIPRGKRGVARNLPSAKNAADDGRKCAQGG